jgi:hypothetical protein
MSTEATVSAASTSIMISQKVTLPCMRQMYLIIFPLPFHRPAAPGLVGARNVVALAGRADGSCRPVQDIGYLQERLALGPQLPDLGDLFLGQRTAPNRRIWLGVGALKVDVPTISGQHLPVGSHALSGYRLATSAHPGMLGIPISHLGHVTAASVER